MARPALVIGLGGTGQWVLTFLKQELIEACIPDRAHPENLRENGLPKGVRLLAFDTVAQRVIQGSDQPSTEINSNDQRMRKVGDVSLEEQTEYVYFGGDIGPAVNIIWKGPQAQNYPVYECQNWLKESYPTFQNLPSALMHAADGAGAIRQVGRMALIEDLRRENSVVLGRIQQAVQEIVDELGDKNKIESTEGSGSKQQRKLEVIFVCSLAGGTGAGIFIDIALWCRQILDARFPGATNFRAFLVSPFAFTSPGVNPDTGKMARSFAAWRELNRFLTVGAQNQSGMICYDGLNIKKQISLKNRLFDVTYMIDPNREVNPLPAGHPEKNLYPSIAQAIAAVLDPKSGGMYTEDVVNLEADLKDKDLHCAFGAYTIKVPIYYHYQNFTSNLEDETFKKLFVPTFDATGLATGVSGMANPEHSPADVGRMAVVNILRKTNFPYQGTTYINSGLWHKIADCLDKNWQKDNGIIERTARGFGSDSNWGSFGQAGILDQLNTRTDGQEVLTDINRNGETRLLHELVPLTSEPLRDLSNNVPIIERILTDHFSDTVDNPGSFKRTLKAAGDVQFEMFIAFLRAVMEQELNGLSSDQKVAKCGKIGWVREFLLALRDGLIDYQEFCTKVLNRASAQDVAGEINSTAAKALNNFKQNAGKKAWITVGNNNGVHPIAHDAEREYYDKAQRVANFKRENLLFIQQRDSAATLQKFIEASLEDLEAWINVFVTGGTQRVNNQPVATSGVYSEIKREAKENQQEYQDIQSDQAQLEYIGKVDYPDINIEIVSNLNAFVWKVGVSNAHSRLLFDLVWGKPLSNGRRADGTYDLADGVKKSHAVIHDQCGVPFIKLITQSAPNTVFNEIQKKYKDGSSFAVHIQNKANPFWRMTAGGLGPHAENYGNPYRGLIALRTSSTFEGVQADQTNKPQENAPETADQQTDSPFIVELRKRLESAGGVSYNFSERYDPFCFTLVRTDNAISSRDFNVFAECQNAYLNAFFAGDSRSEKTNLEQFHIFPPEVHAAQYEREIAVTLRQNFTLLSPEVVGLLNNKERVDDFFKAVALGVIRRQLVKDTNGKMGYAWVYQLENSPLAWLWDQEITPIAQESINSYQFLINRVVYQGNDVRVNVSQVNKIDWEKLHVFVWNSELNHTALPKYKAQYEIPEDTAGRQALLDAAAQQIQDGKADVVWPILADLALKGLVDLAHLAELNYRNANHEPVSPNDGHAVI